MKYNKKIYAIGVSALTILISGASIVYAALTFSSTAVTSDGALTLTGAASSTWDLGGNFTLSLQTTNNGPITTGTGLLTIAGSSTVNGLLDAKNIDRNGPISIGTSSATSIVIGDGSTNSVKIGNGTGIIKHISATSSLNFGTIASTTCAEANIAVTGAAAGDSVVLGPPSTISSTLIWNGYSTGTNTATVRLCSVSSTAITAAQTWRADIWKH